MTRFDWFCRIGIATLLAGVLVGACNSNKEDGAAHMPPAAGPGAPERKALPTLPKADQAAAANGATVRETTGTTFPRAQAQVGPNMSGVLAKVLVEEGDLVKKNDLLFRLRGQDFDLQVQRAQAALKSAEVGMKAVKVEYDRTQRLVEKNAINQAAWDQVQAQYESAQAGVAQAKVALAMAQKARADAAVRSPIAGVITAKLKNEGEMVTMMPPSVVVVVEDHSVLELRFRLPEQEVSALSVGDTVQAAFTAVGMTRDAKVVRISPSVDPRTRTIEVVTEIPNADGQLKAGMLAKILVAAEARAAAGSDDASKAADTHAAAGEAGETKAAPVAARGSETP